MLTNRRPLYRITFVRMLPNQLPTTSDGKMCSSASYNLMERAEILELHAHCYRDMLDHVMHAVCTSWYSYLPLCTLCGRCQK